MRYRSTLQLLPTFAILFFVGLYVYAATLYPGGSQADATSAGYDWVNNYWCNLLNERAMNGELNPARPYAISAMGILCAGLILFFLRFPGIYFLSQAWSIIVQILGTISMVCALLVFTKYHDLMTSLASIAGLVALVGVFYGLYKSGVCTLLRIGWLCCLLMGINNYIYYSGNYLSALPLIQKITFAVVLFWISSVSLTTAKKSI